MGHDKIWNIEITENLDRIRALCKFKKVENNKEGSCKNIFGFI